MAKEIKRNIPRDVFMHLLAVVTLYWSSVTFVSLLWQYINKFFPDILSYDYIGLNEITRFAISSLIIVFPVFILVSWYLNKIYAREAVVRESKIRKWLIYLTLFVAALVIIGDLVTTINTFLNGEIKTRFILKALSILVVAVFVFWYYLDDVRKESPTKLAKPFAWGTSALVLIVVVGAFFIVGSPAEARLVRFDQQKISDLQMIQERIINYWQSKEKLPAILDDLNDPLGFKVPVDPQTNQPYEYIVIDAANLSFQLCATFNKESNYETPDRPMGYMENWQHKIGDYCFIRTIDKQLYPPFSKIKQ